MCIRADNLHIFQPKQQAAEEDTDPAPSSKQDMDHQQKILKHRSAPSLSFCWKIAGFVFQILLVLM